MTPPSMRGREIGDLRCVWIDLARGVSGALRRLTASVFRGCQPDLLFRVWWCGWVWWWGLQTARLWTLASGVCAHELREHTHVVECVAFSNAAADAVLQAPVAKAQVRKSLDCVVEVRETPRASGHSILSGSQNLAG